MTATMTAKAIGESINNEILLEVAVETTRLLNMTQHLLQNCRWSDGESNTDTDFSRLACKCAEEAWTTIRQLHPQLNEITMRASIPDINCMFYQDTGTGTSEKLIKPQKSKIELKSSKGAVMPGSTIGKLDINQPLIYCRRPESVDKPYEVRCGQYHTAMGESMCDMFQDRTPRPPISFAKLSVQPDLPYQTKEKDAWIPHYAKCAVNRVDQKMKSSWQDKLVQHILLEALQGVTPENLEEFKESLRLSLL